MAAGSERIDQKDYRRGRTLTPKCGVHVACRSPLKCDYDDGIFPARLDDY